MDRFERERAENERVDGLTGVLNPTINIVAKNVGEMETVRKQWEKMESIPFLVAGRDAAIDNSFPGMDVRSYLTGDNSSGRMSVHDVVIQPGGGLPAHCLEQSDLFFYVVEGTPNVTVGNLSEVSRPETYGYVPSETTCALLNSSDQPARLLCIFIPAGIEIGFADAHDHWVRTGDTAPETYREILGRYGFRFDLAGPLPNDARVNIPLERVDRPVESIEDFEALREEWYKRPPVPRLVYDRSACVNLSLKDGDTLTEASIVFGGDDTRGRGMFIHGDLGEGYSALPHFQPSEEEIFFLVRGNLTLQCGNRTFELKPGHFGFAPRGASHGFVNPGPGPCLLLTLNAPAGHEIGLERLMEIVNGARDPAGLVSMMENHGWVTHSPDWGSRWDGEEAAE